MAGPDFPRQLAAEALGTGLLVATVIGSGIMAARLAAGNTALALLGNTIPTGAILVVLITILGPISGAHLNPAVSLVMALRKRLAWNQLASYAAAQVAGGCAGALLANAMFDLPVMQVATTVRGGAGQLIGETVATFSLIGAILGALRFAPQSVPLIVGLTISAAYWFTSSTSFANPAVTLARALADSFAGIAPASVPAFIVAQLAGALAGLGVWGWLFGPNPES
ncbi:MAG: aquaporin family protein [Hyphomicrobiales bacterium]|nr:aquaporin family protein [Hyphomicrobiales bacterium]